MDNQNRNKNRIFVPVTLKMVDEAKIGPDDSCEIDGEVINDVIKFNMMIVCRLSLLEEQCLELKSP
jgi:hypothetical protein